MIHTISFFSGKPKYRRYGSIDLVIIYSFFFSINLKNNCQLLGESFIFECEHDKQISFLRINPMIPKKLDQFLKIQKEKSKNFAIKYLQNLEQLAILKINGRKLDVNNLTIRKSLLLVVDNYSLEHFRKR